MSILNLFFPKICYFSRSFHKKKGTPIFANPILKNTAIVFCCEGSAIKRKSCNVHKYDRCPWT